MRHILAIGVVAVVAALGVSACAAPGTPPALGASDLALTSPAGAREVDKIVWGLPAGEPTTLNPIEVGDDSANTVNSNLCENVMRLQPDFSVTPALAESADWTDPTTFVIRLRHGVKFWDGTEMTADDLLYSLQLNADPDSGSVYNAALANVDGMSITASNEVTIRFSAHDSQFRNALSTPAGVVLQKAYSENAGKAMGTADGGLMCTGPFKLASWTPGNKIAIVANDDYWTGQRPKVREIDFRFIPDDSTLTTALASGDVDGAYTIPNTSINTLRTSPKGRMFFGPGTASLSFGPTAKTGPAANPVVREALNLAIDKQDFIKTALGGYAQPLRTFTPPFAFKGMSAAKIYQAGYDALNTGGYDLERAKQLVAGLHLDRTHLVYAVQAGQRASLTAATIVQQAGKKIGLDISIRQMQATDFANIFYEESAREGIDFVGTIGYVDAPGVVSYASDFVLPDGLYNWTGFDDPRVTDLMSEARNSSDPVASARAFVAAQAIFAPARLQVSLAQLYSTMFLNDRLTGATVSFAYINSPWALNLGGK